MTAQRIRQAVASVLAAWFGGERSEQRLQGVINAEIRQPGEG
jgi:hypothetical protein